MNISIFLAQALGMYLFIMGTALVVNREVIRDFMEYAENNHYVIFIIGVITTVVGILLVLSHNIWVADWRVLITLLAWSTLIAGVIRMVKSQWCANVIHACLTSERNYNMGVLIVLIFSLIFLYHGFFN